jgi:serine protease Do
MEEFGKNTEQPREVSESYERPYAPREVVLSYERDFEPEREKRAEERLPSYMKEAKEKKRRKPKHGKRGVIVFAALCAAAVCFALAARFVPLPFEDDGTSSGARGDRDILWFDESKSDESSAVHIAAAEHGLGVSIGYGAEETEELSAQEVYEKMLPSVVTVAARQSSSTASIGTGVILTKDGYILTNAHVIEGGNDCTVILDTGDSYDAGLVGYDEGRDVAVLKIDASDLTPADICDSGSLSVGEKAYAIGNPLGLELRGTLTDGIISAINRDVNVNGRTMTLIQTNAALNPGNSGGPLINSKGQVVGINTIKMGSSSYTVEGIGFAIPSSEFVYLVNQILEYGYALPETKIGITVTPAELDGGKQGLLVYSVETGSCADAAGIRQGDVITAADGRELSSSSELLELRRKHAPGDTMTFTVLRGKETLEISVTLDAAD